ncbi:MAG: hypothetical protein KGZ50_03735 [Peptococcaceae bacterium]|nr:hypothetical protein [Peptococcaceae bacterium]
MSEKMVVDILTLDSVQCAACQYMLEAVSALPENVRQHIEFKEWNIKGAEGINKFLGYKARVLPTIVINGDIVFESIIPMYEELLDALAARAPEVLKTEIAKVRDAI